MVKTKINTKCKRCMLEKDLKEANFTICLLGILSVIGLIFAIGVIYYKNETIQSLNSELNNYRYKEYPSFEQICAEKTPHTEYYNLDCKLTIDYSFVPENVQTLYFIEKGKIINKEPWVNTTDYEYYKIVNGTKYKLDMSSNIWMIQNE